MLVHCSRSASLGNYMRSVPAAVLLGLLLDRAIVLRCDRPWKDPKTRRKVLIDSQLAAYFRGAHFEPWSTVADGRSEILLLRSECSRRDCNRVTTLGAAFATGENLSAVGILRVSTNTDADVEAILASRAAAAAAKRKLGEELLAHANLAGCLLRYVFAPSARLVRLEAALPNLPPLSSHGLRLAVAAHVRLGDSVFFPAAARSAARMRSHWEWAKELQGLAYRRNPMLAMRCLQVASASAAVGCLGCAVLSDAAYVERCATRLLDAPLLTPGVATHPLASPAGAARSTRTIEKLVLDWWILARSHATLLFSGNAVRIPSTLALTAVRFRDAGASPSAVATIVVADGSLNSRWREHCTLPMRL